MTSGNDRLATILRWCIYAAAFVPLIIFRDYISPFHFGKVIVFRTLVEVMLVLYAVLVWRDRSYVPKVNALVWALLAFTGTFVITTVTSTLPYPSFWGTLERMGGLWSFVHYIAFFVIAISVLKSRRQWVFALELSVLVGILSAFYGYCQRTDLDFCLGSGSRERIFGTIGNAALFAGYEIINIFLALTLLLQPEIGAWKRRFLYAGVGFGILAVAMTVVRGSILGLGAGLLLYFLLRYLRDRDSQSKNVLATLAVLAALAGIVIITPLKETSFIQDSRFLSRLTDTSFEAFTAKTRFWAWEAGLKGWSENVRTIVVGWGPENFNLPFSKHFNPKFFNGFGSETLFDRAHNMFIEVLVTMGLLGLIAYAGIFAVPLKKMFSEFRSRTDAGRYAAGLIPLIVAYVIHNLFIFDTSANYIAFFLALGFVNHLYFARPAVEHERPRAAYSPAQIAVGSVLLAGALVLAYQTNVVQAKANYATTRAIVLGWTLDAERKEGVPSRQGTTFDGIAQKYREALSYDVPGKYEYRHRLAQYLFEYANRYPGPTAGLAESLRYAIAEVQKNADDRPGDYLPELYLSRLNITLGKDNPASVYNDEALRHSMKALSYSPTFVRTYYEIAQAYLNKKEYGKAIEYFKKAAELNPDAGVSYWYWAMVEIDVGTKTGNTAQVVRGLELAETALAKGFVAREGDYRGLVKAYLDRGDFARLAFVYEKLVELSPQNAEYYTSLAYAYSRLGRIDDAVMMARRAVLIDPSIMAEARAFVRGLGRDL